MSLYTTLWVVFLCSQAFFCLTFAGTLSQNATILSTTAAPEDHELTVVEHWQKFEERVKSISSQVLKLILPNIMDLSNTVNISSSCMREAMLLVGGVKKIRTWALRFVDASAKMIDGVLTGTMSSFGAYDQCITTSAFSEKPKEKGKVLFTGKYCTVDMKPALPPKRDFYKLNEVLDELKNFSSGKSAINEAAKYAHFFYFISIRLGICVPSGCSKHDVQQVATLIGDYFHLNAKATRCEMKEENQFPPLVIGVIAAFSFMGLMMLIGSLIDMYCYYYKRTFNHLLIRLLLAFSFISNFRRFADTSTSSDTLSCLNGIRFLCMSWVVLGHTYLINNYQIFKGLESVRNFAKDFAFQAIVNASVAVDTFFCIGGLLVCYLTVKIVNETGKKFNLKLYVFHRLWRIIPVYAFVVMYMFLSDLTGSGPIWHDTTDHYVEACYENWWSNFLFINNFYHAEKMCIPQSWYIASDFQLYIAALLVLLPMLRWPKVGLSLAGFGVIASMVFAGVGTYINNYPPTMLFAHPDPEQRNDYWATFYFKPYVHAGPYCIGILAGYLLATRPKLKIPRTVLTIGWSLAIISNMSVLYGAWEWNCGREPTFWETMIYSSCNRVAWTLGVAWMIVCCATGHGGVINYILSWKAWIPLGRLTFIVYLIHPIVQITAVGNIRARVQPRHYFAIWVYFGHLCITYGAAFAGTMLVEAPFLALEKIIMPKSDRKKVTEIHSNNGFKGDLSVSKTGDISTVIPVKEIVSEESDNKVFVYKL